VFLYFDNCKTFNIFIGLNILYQTSPLGLAFLVYIVYILYQTSPLGLAFLLYIVYILYQTSPLGLAFLVYIVSKQLLFMRQDYYNVHFYQS